MAREHVDARYKYTKTCVMCNTRFTDACPAQECCSKECKKSLKIKKSNELWLKRKGPPKGNTFNQGYGIL